MRIRSKRFIPAVALLAASMGVIPAFAQRPAPPKSVRLYIFDCGKITGVGAASFGFKDGELATTDMTTPCFLIVHPRGTLMWDVGEIADSAFKADGSPATQGAFTATKPLLPQLAAIGYKPSDITYLALSHYHGDHVANANAFAGSTWIVQDIERKAMFAPPDDTKKKGPGTPNPVLYGALEKSKTVILQSEDHDVFGDGTVVIKFTPGHTPGHQSLFLKLEKTGPVLLSGDLYHYPEELTLQRTPAFEFDKDQTAKSRVRADAFVKQAGAQLWIQHDAAAGATRKKSPEYYD
jgi:glyoxylase-like metal-dependent hydrolase (beta-lactamase superfamily II)